MKSISNIIKKAFKDASNKGYDHIVVAVDLHDTIITSQIFNTAIADGYSMVEAIDKSITEAAKNVLQTMTLREDIQLMLFSGTKQETLIDIAEIMMHEYGIEFEHINTYVTNDPIPLKSQNFKSKPYYSILFDDKCGFDYTEDWLTVDDSLILYTLSTV